MKIWKWRRLRASHRLAVPAVARLSTCAVPAAHRPDGLEDQARSSGATGEERAEDRPRLAARRATTARPLQPARPATTERRPGAPDPAGLPVKPCSWPGQKTRRRKTRGRPPYHHAVPVHHARCQRGGPVRRRVHMARRRSCIRPSARLQRGRRWPHQVRRPGAGRRLQPPTPTQTPTLTTRHKRCVEAAGE